jgi:hypothetical protein
MKCLKKKGNDLIGVRLGPTRGAERATRGGRSHTWLENESRGALSGGRGVGAPGGLGDEYTHTHSAHSKVRVSTPLNWLLHMVIQEAHIHI